jgi:hypothetical protein
MFKLKIILLFLIGSGAITAWLYVSHLRSENQILTINASKLDEVIQAKEEEIRIRTEDATIKQTQLRKRMKQIAALSATSAALNKQLTEVTHDDPVVVECLKVKPGVDYINQLRQHTGGQSNNEGGEVVPGAIVLSDPST